MQMLSLEAGQNNFNIPMGSLKQKLVKSFHFLIFFHHESHGCIDSLRYSDMIAYKTRVMNKIEISEESKTMY